jgi:hypothetical protein
VELQVQGGRRGSNVGTGSGILPFSRQTAARNEISFAYNRGDGGVASNSVLDGGLGGHNQFGGGPSAGASSFTRPVGAQSLSLRKPNPWANREFPLRNKWNVRCKWDGCCARGSKHIYSPHPVHRCLGCVRGHQGSTWSLSSCLTVELRCCSQIVPILLVLAYLGV